MESSSINLYIIAKNSGQRGIIAEFYLRFRIVLRKIRREIVSQKAEALRVQAENIASVNVALNSANFNERNSEFLSQYPELCFDEAKYQFRTHSVFIHKS